MARPIVAAAAATCLIIALAGCAAPSTDAPAAATVESTLPGWQEFVLPGKRRTAYRAGHEDGRLVIRADAQGSASMLRHSVRLEPAQVAQVEFSWRVDELVADADLGVAEKSDSPVRVVFAFDGDRGALSLRDRAAFELAEILTGEAPPYATLMYVWDNRADPGSLFHSHRTDRVRKIVLESGAGRRGQWLAYRRDLVADFKRAFGEEPGRLIGIGYMSDGDNTGNRALARYGEVRLIGANGLPL